MAAAKVDMHKKQSTNLKFKHVKLTVTMKTKRNSEGQFQRTLGNIILAKCVSS